MSAVSEFVGAVRTVAEAAAPGAAVQRGPITAISASGSSYIVTVDLGYPLVVTPEGLSGPFLGELVTAATTTGGVQSLVGRKVEVTFSAGRQAAIAYTVGV